MLDYMTSAASNTANTEMLTSVPNTTLSLISVGLQAVNGRDVLDDAGLLVVWASYEVRELEKTVKYSEELQELLKRGNEHE